MRPSALDLDDTYFSQSQCFEENRLSQVWSNGRDSLRQDLLRLYGIRHRRRRHPEMPMACETYQKRRRAEYIMNGSVGMNFVLGDLS